MGPPGPHCSGLSWFYPRATESHLLEEWKEISGASLAHCLSKIPSVTSLKAFQKQHPRSKPPPLLFNLLLFFFFLCHFWRVMEKMLVSG